jgi:hypothetical protein
LAPVRRSRNLIISGWLELRRSELFA